MNMPGEYDAIVIGTGAGGGTLALHLAQAGKNILILERGSFMPQEKLNWDTSAVFLDNRYHTKETWQDKDGKPLHPQQAYFVGGQTKVYGAAMFRMREHLRRLQDSAKVYSMDMPYSGEHLSEAILELLRINKMGACYVKPMAMRGSSSLSSSTVSRVVSLLPSST